MTMPETEKVTKNALNCAPLLKEYLGDHCSNRWALIGIRKQTQDEVTGEDYIAVAILHLWSHGVKCCSIYLLTPPCIDGAWHWPVCAFGFTSTHFENNFRSGSVLNKFIIWPQGRVDLSTQDYIVQSVSFSSIICNRCSWEALKS